MEREVLRRALEAAAGPAMLLAPVGAEAHRQLGGRLEAAQVPGAPPGEEGAVGDVEVLGQRVVLPAAGLDQRSTAPHPGRAVEVEPVAAAPTAPACSIPK